MLPSQSSTAPARTQTRLAAMDGTVPEHATTGAMTSLPYSAIHPDFTSLLDIAHGPSETDNSPPGGATSFGDGGLEQQTMDGALVHWTGGSRASPGLGYPFPAPSTSDSYGQPPNDDTRGLIPRHPQTLPRFRANFIRTYQARGQGHGLPADDPALIQMADSMWRAIPAEARLHWDSATEAGEREREQTHGLTELSNEPVGSTGAALIELAEASMEEVNEHVASRDKGKGRADGTPASKGKGKGRATEAKKKQPAPRRKRAAKSAKADALGEAEISAPGPGCEKAEGGSKPAARRGKAAATEGEPGKPSKSSRRSSSLTSKWAPLEKDASIWPSTSATDGPLALTVARPSPPYPPIALGPITTLDLSKARFELPSPETSPRPGLPPDLLVSEMSLAQMLEITQAQLERPRNASLGGAPTPSTSFGLGSNPPTAPNSLYDMSALANVTDSMTGNFAPPHPVVPEPSTLSPGIDPAGAGWMLPTAMEHPSALDALSVAPAPPAFAQPQPARPVTHMPTHYFPTQYPEAPNVAPAVPVVHPTSQGQMLANSDMDGGPYIESFAQRAAHWESPYVRQRTQRASSMSASSAAQQPRGPMAPSMSSSTLVPEVPMPMLTSSFQYEGMPGRWPPRGSSPGHSRRHTVSSGTPYAHPGQPYPNDAVNAANFPPIASSVHMGTMMDAPAAVGPVYQVAPNHPSAAYGQMPSSGSAPPGRGHLSITIPSSSASSYSPPESSTYTPSTLPSAYSASSVHTPTSGAPTSFSPVHPQYAHFGGAPGRPTAANRRFASAPVVPGFPPGEHPAFGEQAHAGGSAQDPGVVSSAPPYVANYPELTHWSSGMK